MQVNSAQDYLTYKKRQILAQAATVAPSPQKRKTNALFTSVTANQADQRVRFIAPIQSQPQPSATYTSRCCSALSQGTI
jgi:hypothetical protein